MRRHRLSHSYQPKIELYTIIVLVLIIEYLWELTAIRTLNCVSRCHRMFGEYRSAAKIIPELHWALNSASDFSKKSSSSLVIVRIFWLLIRANDSSIARRRIDTSGSLRHSKIVVRCRWTADVSACTVLNNVFNATYRIFLSEFNRKRPKILTANTRRPPSELKFVLKWE